MIQPWKIDNKVFPDKEMPWSNKGIEASQHATRGRNHDSYVRYVTVITSNVKYMSWLSANQKQNSALSIELMNLLWSSNTVHPKSKGPIFDIDYTSIIFSASDRYLPDFYPRDFAICGHLVISG